MTTALGNVPSLNKRKRYVTVDETSNIPVVDVCPLLSVGVEPSVVYRSVAPEGMLTVTVNGDLKS